jgi:ecdysone 20-monooxygenase
MKVTGGYEIPSGSIVFCHHRLASLQEENFTDAKSFIPERWIDEECDPSWNRESR